VAVQGEAKEEVAVTHCAGFPVTPTGPTTSGRRAMLGNSPLGTLGWSGLPLYIVLMMANCHPETAWLLWNGSV